MDLYFKLILFYVISVLYFLSVAGYGKIITNKKSNYFETYLDGTILLLIISYFIYITYGTNSIINSFILFNGLILYFIFYKDFKTIKFRYIFYLLLSIFSVLIISKTHEDFNLYHYFSIFEIYNHNLRIGVSNLNNKFYHKKLIIDM